MKNNFYNLTINLAAIIISTGFQSCGTAQTTDNNSLREKITNICSSAKIIEVEEKSGYFEVEYECNGEIFEAVFNNIKELIQLESEAIVPTKIDEKIQKKLDKKFEGWLRDETLLIETNDTLYYKIRIVRNGIEDNVYFTLEGKYYKAFYLPANEPWTMEMLAESYLENTQTYDFLSPDETYELPEILLEVSGIELESEQKMLCIQDEKGAIYEFDLKKNEITNVIQFSGEGDFEDLAVSDNEAYVLRSDGLIFVLNYKNHNSKPSQSFTNTGSENVEGLFFDTKSGALLMACKGKSAGQDKKIRMIYQFTPESIHQPKEYLKINEEDIVRLISEKYAAFPIEISGMQFHPSAIALHPVTGDCYILSAKSRMLTIFDGKNLKDIFLLPSEIFYKPEGLIFSPKGDLYISSEGMKNGQVPGRIFQFNHR